MYKVYRVEHSESKQGPYTSINQDLCDRHNKYTTSHPTAGRLSIRIQQHYSKDFCLPCGFSDVLCGFDSMSNLGNWFRGFRGNLKSRGFIIAVYTLDPIYTATDGRQVIFDRSKALLIEKRDVGT